MSHVQRLYGISIELETGKASMGETRSELLLPPDLTELLRDRVQLIRERRMPTRALRREALKKAKSEEEYKDGPQILFGSVASRIATFSSDTDMLRPGYFRELAYGIFSPHEILNAGREERAEIKSRIEVWQESEMLWFMHHKYKGNGRDLTGMLTEYIHDAHGGSALSERVERKKTKAEEVESKLIADMLPQFISTLQRLNEQGKVKMEEAGEYRLTAEIYKKEEVTGKLSFANLKRVASKVFGF